MQWYHFFACPSKNDFNFRNEWTYMNEQNQSDEISLKELIIKLKEWFDYLI
jgi:hypothetical protein